MEDQVLAQQLKDYLERRMKKLDAEAVELEGRMAEIGWELWGSQLMLEKLFRK